MCNVWVLAREGNVQRMQLAKQRRNSPITVRTVFRYVEIVYVALVTIKFADLCYGTRETSKPCIR